MRHTWKTEDDLLALPDDEMRHELVAGLIVAEPLPFARHDRVRRRLETLLEEFVASPRLGEVFGEAGYLLARNPDTVRGPDLSFVRAERLVDFDDTRFFRGAPDLAVEILSPSNRAGQVRAKVADYLNAGCPLVWVIDPSKKFGTAYRSLDAPRRITADESLDGEDVLPGLSIPLASIFQE
jgi:Uma2 family endonuclease